MKLLISTTSPYARKAHIVVLEKSVPCDIVIANPWDDDPQVARHNPLRKIPLLLTDDGGAIMDSRVICEYLDAQNGSPKFLPDDFARRMAVKSREALAEGALDAALAVIMAGRVDKQMQSAAWREWLLNKTEGALDKFEGDIGGRGEDLDMSDIACACLLDVLMFRLPDRHWLESRPQLSAWRDKVAARESFCQTYPRA